MADKEASIKITGKVNYEDKITIRQAAKIISFLNADDSDASESFDPGGSVDNEVPSRNDKVNPVKTPRDALELSGAKTNPEKIAALGAYVVQVGEGTFKIEDVRSQFRRAREPAPANFGRDLTRAMEFGWVGEEEDAPGEYFLTAKLDGILDGGFTFPKGSGGGRKGAGRKAAPKAKVTKVTMPDSLGGISEFLPTLQGYQAYSKMKSEKDRLLWVAVYMRDKYNREGVTNKEVAWISARIGVGIPSNNVGSAFRSAKNPGYAYRSGIDETIRVTDEGVAYLAALVPEA